MTTKQLLLFSLFINSGIFTSIIAMYHPNPLPDFFFIRSNADFFIPSNSDFKVKLFPVPNAQGVYQYPAPWLTHYKPQSINENLYQKCIQQILETNSNRLRAIGVKEEAITFYRQRIGILTDSYTIELIKLNSGR